MKPYIVEIPNRELSDRAETESRSLHPLKKNWSSTIATKKIVPVGQIISISFRYGGRASRYQGFEYHPAYTSFLSVNNKYQAVYSYGFEGEMKNRNLTAPKGMEWDKDGSLVFSSDFLGEYHPTYEDLIAPNFAIRCRNAAKENYQKRIAIDKERRQSDKWNFLLEEHLDSVAVTLIDSRRAGNCDGGSLDFASRLGINPKTARSAPWMVSLPSKVLLRTKNSLAERACLMACWRETVVSI